MSTSVPQTVPIEVALQRAIAHHEAGQLQEAERLYRTILQAQPYQPDANHNLGVLAGQVGQHAAGLPYLKTALAINPSHGQYALSYAEALLASGQAREALNVLQSAMQGGLNTPAAKALRQRAEAAALGVPGKGAPTPVEMSQLVALFNAGRHVELEGQARLLLERYPDSGLGWKALGLSLQEQGEDGLAALRKAAELLPEDAEAHNNLGLSLQDRGQLDDAVASCRRALQIKPDYAEAHNNLGNALRALGQFDDAVASFRRALQIKPDYAKAHSNLGNALKDLGRFDGAVASCRRALQIDPDLAEAHCNLGNALHQLKQLDTAVASYRRALQIKPDLAEAHYNLGIVLQELGHLDDAIASYRQALQIKPDYVEAHSNLGVVLQELKQFDAAAASCRRALQINPGFAQAHSNLGNALQVLGQLDDAAASYRRALEIKPDYVETHSNMLGCISQSETVDAQALFAEHGRFAEQFEAPLRGKWPVHSNPRNPERCLQVGFVSADLRYHAAASFIEPVLAHLSSQRQLSLHAYHNHAAEDHVTERLRGYFAHWHRIVGLSDEALAQKIREDGIDILIDLSGHTGKHRLLAFARKPAPVQASWIGYPGTTGLRAMDYYLTDRFFLPHEQFASQFTEELVYLPAEAPFMPSKEAPSVNALPALSNGYVTFGSFNRLSKISRSVIALWAQLLRALPESRMLLGGMPQAGENGTLVERFAQEGIARERLSFHARSAMGSYLGLHQQVDICLDTFPYNGGTTTFHALWMGVPTLTLAGGTPASRSGVSILGHVGLEAFVAHDKEEFVQKGLSWAGDIAALSEIRSGLRERFANSAIGQPTLVAEGLERALRIMWRRWCAGLPAESFEVSLQDHNNRMQEAGT